MKSQRRPTNAEAEAAKAKCIELLEQGGLNRLQIAEIADCSVRTVGRIKRELGMVSHVNVRTSTKTRESRMDEVERKELRPFLMASTIFDKTARKKISKR